MSRVLGRPRGHVPVEHRLDEILENAARLFRDKGYRGTRLDDIADRLGVTRAALYYYFESKQELLQLVCARAMDASETVLAVSAETEDPAQRLREFAHGFASVMTSDMARVFFRERSELEPVFRRRLMQRSRRLTQGARDIVAEGVKEGAFRADVDRELAALGLLSMINSMSQWFRPGGRFSAEEIVDAFVDVYLHGLTSPDARRTS